MKGNTGKKFLSLCLSVIMVLGMLPTAAFATSEGTVFSIGPCEHHECATDVCGVAEAIEGVDCTHEHDAEVCAYDEAEDTCTHEHDEACGFVEAIPAQSCMYMCAICGVQSLIDALPTEFASEEEVEAFWAKVESIDGAMENMRKAEVELLDLTNYDLAVDAAAAFVNPEFDDATTLEGENEGEENVEEIAEGEHWYDADATELVIDTVEAFKEFAKLSQNGNSFSGKTIKLGANIDFAGENYLEIAEDGTVVTDYRIPKFSGTFDGGNYTIKNLNYVVENTGKNHIMMFSQDSMWAYIKNLNLENITVNVADISGQTRITALANRVNAGGMTDAAIKNVHVKNFKITSDNTTSGDLRIGGLAYFVQGSQLIAKDCSIDGFVVDVNEALLVGGAVAVVKSKCDFENVDVKNAVFNIDKFGSSGIIGGFVGQTQDQGTGTTFTDCDVDVAMDLGVVTNNIGGFAGSIGSVSQFYDCTVTGSIKVTDGASIGGFVGDLGWNGMFAPNVQHEFNNCIADVDITAAIGNVGGFIGNSTVAGYPERFMPTYFNSCEAKGDVATENGAAGGFVGTGDRGIFNDCSASGDVEGTIAGGFWGEVYPKAKAEFSDGWSYQNKEVTHNDENAKSIVLEELTVSGTVTGTVHEAGLIGLVDNAHDNADGYVTPIILNNNSTNDVDKSEDAVIEIPVELITEINTLEDLKLFRDLVNAGYDYAGKTVTLNADIDLSNEVWTPIGTSNYDKTPTTEGVKMFAGNFDGGNHTITGLSSVGYVPAAEDTGSTEYSFGLFGYAYGANFKDVKFANVNIECGTRANSAGTNVYGSGNAALVGYYVPKHEAVTVIENCHVLSGTISASNNMGGLIGHMDSQLSQPKVDITISNCSNAADVTTEAREAGGILGLMNSAREGNYIATMRGIVTFKDCVNTGAITSLGGGAPSAGGILGRDHNQAAGQHLKIIFDGCENSGTITVTANGETHAAGIGAGYYAAGAWLIAKDCKNTGDVVVNGSGDIYAGGLISYGGVVELINSTSTGTVTGDNKYVGGAHSILFIEKMVGYADTVSGYTYHLNGGTSPEREYLVDNAGGGGNFILVETAYKTGFDFGGWYDNAEFTGNAYTALNKNVKHYYAKWIGPVAKIGEAEYTSLEEAFAAAQDGDTITLIADVTTSVGITNTKKVTLDLNGYTVFGVDNATGSFGLITNKGELTITGEGKMTLRAATDRDWNAYSSVISNTVGGKLIVASGTIEHLGGTDMAYGIDNLTNGKGTYAETVINGGTVKSPYRAIRQFLNGVEAQNILTVNDGTIQGENKAIWMQDPSAKANTGTLTVSENAVIKGNVYLDVTEGSTEWPVTVSVAAAALQGESTVISENVPKGYAVKNVDDIYIVDTTLDTSWYNDTDTEFVLKDAKDLAGFAHLVDGGNTFEGKTVKLGANIDLADLGVDTEGNALPFDPIGSYRFDRSFKGIFDGQNYAIKNLNQNTWALNNGYAYNDCGLGLFGAVEGTDAEHCAVVKNLIIDGAYISGESAICGSVAAVAHNATFENITIKNAKVADYQYYAGGMIGWASGTMKLINCDVEASTTVGSQWGDFNNANGGLIGGISTKGTYYLQDCDIACRLDAHNDVVSAYEWWSYRSTGMLIGNTGTKADSNTATAPTITAKNCTVTYGEWALYHYCQFSNMKYPWVRVEAGESVSAYTNVRYGHPIDANGNEVVDDNHVHAAGDAHHQLVILNQLYGGTSGDRYVTYGEDVHVNPDGSTGDEVVKIIVTPEAAGAVIVREGKEIGFWTLVDAAKAAQDRDIIKVMREHDIDETVTIPVGKSITLDLNGKTISRTITEKLTKSFALIQNKGTLTVMDSSEAKSGKISVNYTADSFGYGVGLYAISNEGGTLNVAGGTIENLATVTGSMYDAIDNNSTLGNTVLNISGGTVSCGYLGIRQFANSTTAENTVNITGGKVIGGNSSIWTQNPGSSQPKANIVISDGELEGRILMDESTGFGGYITGGTYSDLSYEKYLAPGYVTNIYAENGKVIFGVKIGDASYVAIVGAQKYTTLQEAIDNAESGKTIELLKNFAMEETVTVPAGKTIILDLNGKTITGADKETKSFGLITNKGNLTVRDTVGGGKITLEATTERNWNAYSSVISNTVGGKLTVEGGMIEHKGGTAMAYGIDNLTNGKGTYAEVVVNGGHIKSTYRAIRQFLNGVEAQNILTVNGGVIEGANKAIWMQDPSKNANSGALTVKAEAEIKDLIYLDVAEGSAEWPIEVAIAEKHQILAELPEGCEVIAVDGVYVVHKLDGSGKAEDPYLIKTVSDLELFRKSVNAGETKYNAPGVVVALAADIDMAGATWERGIGDGIKATFDGIFDGKDHTIKNLNMAPKADSDGYFCGGLFGYIYGAAEIKNVVLENINVTATGAGHNVGALVGFAYNKGGKANISGITVKDVVINAPDTYGVGAIVGYSYYAMGTIDNCTVDGATITGYSFVGGITGYSYNDAVINNCLVENTAITATSNYAGGIVGLANPNNTISNSTVANTVTVEAQACAGTVVGAMGGSSVTVANCTAAGTLVGGDYAKKAPVQAIAGDTYYATLEAALKAESGKEIVLMTPVVIEAGKPVVLDLNGNTVTGTDNATGNFGLININPGADLTINDTVGGGKITLTATNNRGWNAYSSVISNQRGKLTVNGGTIEHLGGTDMAYGIDNLTNTGAGDAEVIINGGTVKSTYRAIRLFQNSTAATAILTVNGGTIEGGNKSIWMQNANAKANPGALTVTENASIKGDVYLSASNAAVWPATVSVNALALKDGAQVLGSNIPSGYVIKNRDGIWCVEGNIFRVSTKSELNEALAKAEEGNIILLTADIDYGADQLAIHKAITLDLGGKTLTTRNAWGGMSVKGNPTIKNGTIVHASNTSAIKVWNAAAFEDLVIDVQGKGDANKTIGGIVLQSGSTTKVGSIKNVTIKGAALTNGIETYNCGDATENVIGAMENVTIDAQGTGMLISAPCGTATNCDIKGGTNAIEIWIKGNYSASLDLVNSKVEGGVYAHDEINSNPDIVNNGTLKLTVDETTTGADTEDITLTLARAEENVEGILRDVVDNAKAKVNDTYYATFAEAMNAAQTGDVVTLLADVEATEVILIGKSITINGNDHKVTSSATRVFRVTTSNVEVTLNDVDMVSKAVRVGTNDVRGISIDIVDDVKLTLNNCSVDFEDASANDWAYAVNVTGGSKHELAVNGGTYEGANVINVRGANNTVVVKDTTLNCTYPNNDMYAGACIWVLQNQASSVEATGNTFNGNNAIAFNLGTGTALTESNNTDNTKMVVAKIGDKYFNTLEEALASDAGDEVVLLRPYVVEAGETVVLDLNGKTVSMEKKCEASFEMISNNGSLTVKNGTVSFKDTGAGDPTFGWGSYTIRNTGNLTVENATIEHLGEQAFAKHMICAIFQYSGSTTINGGTISTPNYRSIRLWKGDMTINGGTMDGQVWVQAVDNTANLTITGGTFGPNGNDGSSVFVTNSTYDVALSVTGGTFETKIGCSDAAKLAGAVTGGKFTETAKNGTNAALIADGYKFGEADTDGYYVVRAFTNVAEVNGVGYETLQAAINAANAGDTVTLLADINENVTVNKNLTIDGATFKYTGQILVAGNANSTVVTIKNVNFVDYTADYAIKSNGCKSITVEDCTVNNYAWGLLNANKSTSNIYFKNVVVENSGCGLRWVSGLTATLENVTMTNVENGINVQNTAAKTVTIKNSKITSIGINEKATAVQTFKFEGANTVGTLSTSQYAKYVLADTEATLTAAEGFDVTSGVEGYEVDYKNGTYFLAVYVAEVNGTKYESLQAAVEAANTGDSITVIADHEMVWDGETKIDGSLAAMVCVTGKAVTIDLNGKKLTGDTDKMSEMLYAAFAADVDGSLTLKDSVGTGSVAFTGTATAYSLLMAYETGTKLIVEGGNYALANAHDSLIFYGGKTDAEVVINNGTFTLGNVGTGENGKPWIFNVVGAGEHHILVTGGTFNADINRQHWSNEVLVSETCYTVDNGDGTWTVKGGAKAYVLTGMITGPYYAPKNIGYATFEEAFKAAKDADDKEITLLADYEGNLEIDHAVTIIKNRFFADNLTAAKGFKKTETNTQIVIEAVTYVAQNKETGINYASVSDALNAAKSGETVQLTADAVETGAVTVWVGITLDLNGFTLEAPMAMMVNGSIIKDTTDGDGLLKVAKDYVVLAENNGQMPLYDAGNAGYRFFNLTIANKGYRDEFTATATAAGTMQFRFRPVFGNLKAYELLSKYGASGCGIEIGFELSWTGITSKPQVFLVSDDYVIDATTEMAKGKNITWYLTLSGYEHMAGKTLTGNPMVISGTNVAEYVDTIIEYEVPIK